MAVIVLIIFLKWKQNTQKQPIRSSVLSSETIRNKQTVLSSTQILGDYLCKQICYI